MIDAVAVPEAIAAAIGAHENSADGEMTRPANVRSADRIGDREVLLVLDNCEHVIDSAARCVTSLLAMCRRLRIIATSRQPLDVTGEQQLPLEPLNDDEARELFTLRATAVRPAFAAGGRSCHGPVSPTGPAPPRHRARRGAVSRRCRSRRSSPVLTTASSCCMALGGDRRTSQRAPLSHRLELRRALRRREVRVLRARPVRRRRHHRCRRRRLRPRNAGHDHPARRQVPHRRRHRRTCRPVPDARVPPRVRRRSTQRGRGPRRRGQLPTDDGASSSPRLPNVASATVTNSCHGWPNSTPNTTTCAPPCLDRTAAAATIFASSARSCCRGGCTTGATKLDTGPTSTSRQATAAPERSPPRSRCGVGCWPAPLAGRTRPEASNTS